MAKRPPKPLPEKAVETIAVPTSIDERAWTVRDVGAAIDGRPQDHPTQDYVNGPPERVTWERPHDSI